METSDHSAIFLDVLLEQLIPYLVCSQEVCLKNSVDWEPVIGDFVLTSQLAYFKFSENAKVNTKGHKYKSRIIIALYIISKSHK